MAAVGATNLGLLSSDPASGEFGQLVAPTETSAPRRAEADGSSLSSAARPAATPAPSVTTTVAATAEPATTTANAAPSSASSTTTTVVSLARKASPSTTEPEPLTQVDEHHDETSAPRRQRTPDTRPREGNEHDDD
ncbi:MAG: hypothetical protein ABJD24_02140 [Acidimicrobiales bacterium]